MPTFTYVSDEEGSFLEHIPARNLTAEEVDMINADSDIASYLRGTPIDVIRVCGLYTEDA